MKEGTFVSLSGAEADAYRYDAYLTLYLPTARAPDLWKRRGACIIRGTLPKERVVLEQLPGPLMDKGHYPTIPEEVGILSVTTSRQDLLCEFQ